MAKHYVDCAICGTILSIKDLSGRTADGQSFPMADVLLDTSIEKNGRPIDMRSKMTFVGDKMLERVSRFRPGDMVEIAFTPKCRERFKNGRVFHYNYNLGFRIYMARDDERALQPGQ